ncbi:hypothetical protein V6N11_021798 [Hibiscus sabdariffa]|uniref:ShKT domain-containing protein n=1 Tax=Hibiscus sabdariffa TaxID=183260 RepID=A0ABR2THY8_9ROSI
MVNHWLILCFCLIVYDKGNGEGDQVTWAAGGFRCHGGADMAQGRGETIDAGGTRSVMLGLGTGVVVAWMMSEAVGQEDCHDVIPAPGGGQCDPQSCKDKCAAKWGAAAAGLCVNSFPNLFSCNCSWPCGIKGRKQ